MMKNSDFQEYLDDLDENQFCKFSESVGSIVTFCNYHLVCPYQNKVPLKHRGNDKFECNRQKYMKLKKLLG